jgi:transcriptional regulator with XRE-family HTH domain
MSQKPFPPPYDILTDLIVTARRAAGVTQAELATRLSIGQSAVSKIERGVQRLDMVELHRWLSAIGGQGFMDVARKFDARIRTQTAAEGRWIRTKRIVASPAIRQRSTRKG